MDSAGIFSKVPALVLIQYSPNDGGRIGGSECYGGLFPTIDRMSPAGQALIHAAGVLWVGPVGLGLET